MALAQDSGVLSQGTAALGEACPAGTASRAVSLLADEHSEQVPVAFPVVDGRVVAERAGAEYVLEIVDVFLETEVLFLET